MKKKIHYVGKRNLAIRLTKGRKPTEAENYIVRGGRKEKIV